MLPVSVCPPAKLGLSAEQSLFLRSPFGGGGGLATGSLLTRVQGGCDLHGLQDLPEASVPPAVMQAGAAKPIRSRLWAGLWE